jgi:hypothetical protein
MSRIRMLMTAALILIGSANAEPPKSDTSDLIGAWQLVSVETISPRGEITYPFYGRKPQGLLIYDPSGWMSIQIVSDPKPMVPKDDTRDGFIKSPTAERAAAADGYYAYLGTFTIDAKESLVTHHIKESLYPAERGETVVRHYTIADGHLILIARFREMGEEHQRRLTWERAPRDSRS